MTRKSTVSVMDDASSFRQRVRMAAAQVAGLRPDELSAALAYEIEPFSGIPAAEAEVDWREVDDPDATVKVYDVAARRKGAATAKSAGCVERLVRPVAALAAIALAVAAADAALLARSRAALSRKVAEQTVLDAQIGAVRAKAAEARTEATRIREARAAAEKAQKDVARLRGAYSGIMATVASVCGGHVVVKSFASDSPFGLEMKAVAVSAEAAAETMAALSGAVAGMGWRLTPGPIAASGRGATAEFSCRLVFGEGAQ